MPKTRWHFLFVAVCSNRIKGIKGIMEIKGIKETIRGSGEHFVLRPMHVFVLFFKYRI